MTGKVIHLNSHAHAKLKEYCKVINVDMSELVESLIFDALRDAKFKRSLKAKLKIIPENDTVEVWAASPFWENQDIDDT